MNYGLKTTLINIGAAVCFAVIVLLTYLSMEGRLLGGDFVTKDTYSAGEDFGKGAEAAGTFLIVALMSLILLLIWNVIIFRSLKKLSAQPKFKRINRFLLLTPWLFIVMYVIYEEVFR